MNKITASSIMALALFTAGCSADVSFSIGGRSVEEAATDVIEEDIADLLGWELAASCEDVDDPAVGDVFSCTSPAPTGGQILFEVTVEENMVDVQSQNLVRADAVELFEAAALDLVRADTGATYPDGSFDCGDDTLVIPPDGVVDCQLSLPEGGVQTIEMYDIDPDTGDFFIRAA